MFLIHCDKCIDLFVQGYLFQMCSFFEHRGLDNYYSGQDFLEYNSILLTQLGITELEPILERVKQLPPKGNRPTEQTQRPSQEEKMKPQLFCLIVVLLAVAARNVCAFKIPVETEEDLAGLERHRTETVAKSPSALQVETKKDLTGLEKHGTERVAKLPSALQTLLRRSKRSSILNPQDDFECYPCCNSGGCGICCRYTF